MHGTPVFSSLGRYAEVIKYNLFVCNTNYAVGGTKRCRDAVAAVDDVEHLHLRSNRLGRPIKVKDDMEYATALWC